MTSSAKATTTFEAGASRLRACALSAARVASRMALVRGCSVVSFAWTIISVYTDGIYQTFPCLPELFWSQTRLSRQLDQPQFPVAAVERDAGYLPLLDPLGQVAHGASPAPKRPSKPASKSKTWVIRGKAPKAAGRPKKVVPAEEPEDNEEEEQEDASAQTHRSAGPGANLSNPSGLSPNLSYNLSWPC